MIKRVMLAIALAAGFLIPGVTMAVPQAGASSQSLKVTHNSAGATLHLYVRYCGRSYRAWASNTLDGHTSRGIWIDRNGTTSTALVSGGGANLGGFQWQTTGGGTIHTVTTF